MDKLDRAKRDLVIANRILAMENVVDAYGHISIRHPLDPGRYLLARSLSPDMRLISKPRASSPVSAFTRVRAA